MKIKKVKCDNNRDNSFADFTIEAAELSNLCQLLTSAAGNINHLFPTQDRRQSKTLIVSTNLHVDQNSLETEFFDCHLSPDWRQMAIETLFLAIFDPRSSIGKSVFDCRLSDVFPGGHSRKINHDTNRRVGI